MKAFLMAAVVVSMSAAPAFAVCGNVTGGTAHGNSKLDKVIRENAVASTKQAAPKSSGAKTSGMAEGGVKKN